MATLELRNLHKSYGSGLADTLRDIRLKIDSGEFLILVGPSGCGKSTLMNCIAGLESITGGAILVDGQDISGMSPKDRDIAMVFQSYALYPTMSVRENIAFGLKIRKMPQAAIDEEVARVARLLQIEHLLERKPSQLSGGQQQRVAMGRALARRPKVYLFDEPLSNLDAKLRVEMRTELKLMHQRLKTTTVYVTPRPDRGHDPRRQGGGDEGRRHPAVRHAAADLQRPGQPVRRQLHRFAADEFHSVAPAAPGRTLDRPAR